MTPSELETYCRQRYNAVGDNFYSQAEILNHIYTAQTELALFTNCIKNTYTTTSVASQRAYNFPTNTISIRRVEYNGQRIRPGSFMDDDAYTGNSPDTTTTGTPTEYQQWGQALYLRDVPSTSGLTIKIYSYDMPSEVTIAGSLSVPTRYHMFLSDYVLYTMFAKDKNYDMARYHRDLWEKSKNLALQQERLGEVGDEFRVVKGLDEYWDGPRFI